MWCTIQGIFMLCVVNVVKTMVISSDIGSHDRLPNIEGAIDGTRIMIFEPFTPYFEDYFYHKTRPRYSIGA
jgi:hypothetical protein